MIKKTLIIFFIMCGVCFGAEITTARGTITINNGDTVQRRSMWEGQIDGIKDVTFIGWNFVRKNPHTVVFTNSSNLTFIDCNLTNVELAQDFIIDGSLVMHKRRYQLLGINYDEIEYKNGKTKVFKIENENTPEEIVTLLSTEDTQDVKKIKVKYVHPNTRVISELNSISAIE